MGKGVHFIFKALNLGARSDDAWLQSLHIVSSAENPILQREIASIVPSRIAHRGPHVAGPSAALWPG